MMYLDEGTLNDRCSAVMKALHDGWDLITGPKGTYLIDPNDMEFVIDVPDEVMKRLIALDLITDMKMH